MFKAQTRISKGGTKSGEVCSNFDNKKIFRIDNKKKESPEGTGIIHQVNR